MIEITVQKIHPLAKIPEFKTAAAACFDLVAVGFDREWVEPGKMTVVNTGLVVEFPRHFSLDILARSGLAYSHGVCLANGTGIIDPDYRGELLVLLTSLRDPYPLQVGERIAQARLVPKIPTRLVEGIPGGTARGSGGFGSTGVK